MQIIISRENVVILGLTLRAWLLVFYFYHAAFTCTSACLAEAPAPEKAQKWKEVWRDEFDGDSLNESLWERFSGIKPHNNERQAYDPARVSVADGKLILTADDQPQGGQPYTSGKVVSRNYQKYGRWEVRAKLPGTRGTWPAIWLLPDWKKNRWPTQGEIDIVENRGDQPWEVGSAFHYGSRNPFTHNFKSKAYSTKRQGKPVNFHEGYHVYAVEWEPREIRFYVDGDHFWTLEDHDVEDFLTRQDAPMQLILNLAIGGDYLKQAQPDEISVWPQKMMVDYVRVYQRTKPKHSDQSRKQADEETRVMTFNIRLDTEADGPNAWRHRKSLVVDTINAFKPDLLGLQEVLPNQSTYLDEKLPQYNSVGGGREADGTGEASPILYHRSRYDLIAAGMFWLSDTPEVAGSMTWGNQYPRICTWARLFDRKASTNILVANTHWDHESQQARVAGAKLIVERMSKINQKDEAFILLGDFNAGQENPAMLPLCNENLREAYMQVHDSNDCFGTFHAFSGKPGKQKIDAIYVNQHWEVIAAGIEQFSSGDRFPSDHYPVNTVLQLRTKE